MSSYVFTGPTLAAGAAGTEFDAVYLPPVSQGDVYRVALERPPSIGIIDGYFERVPAVWHKEILWAMSQGIHVFGSASIGALRAAELDQFGMEGVGVIYESFRDGVLEDDDEVALIHGPAEDGYRQFSVPMVNIRCTLRDAEKATVISSGARETLESIAKDLFYPRRSYPLLLRLAGAEGVETAELDRLRAWLPTGERDQKREDAIAMLRRMREHLAAGSPPKRVDYSFEHTEAWDHAWRFGGELASRPESNADWIGPEAFLEEVQLEGAPFVRAREEALTRVLALDEARRHRLIVSPEALEEEITRFRRDRGHVDREDLERWLRDQELDWNRFLRLMEEEVLRRWVEAVTEPHAAAQLPAVLRMTGDYERFRARATEKQHFLVARALENPALSDAEISENDLLAWYFEERLGRRVPSDVSAYAQSVGFSDDDAFRRALLREWYYSTGAT